MQLTLRHPGYRVLEKLKECRLQGVMDEQQGHRHVQPLIGCRALDRAGADTEF